MSCDPVRVMQFLNGDLPPDDMEIMADHLDHCPDCAQAFSDFLQARVMNKEIEAALPDGFFPAATTTSFPFRRAMIRLAVAASVLLVLIAGLFLLKGRIANQTAGLLADSLEKAPYDYVSGVHRGGGGLPPDPRRESILALYAEGQYDAFLRQGEAWRAGHGEDERFLFYSGVAAYLLNRDGEAGSYLERALKVSSERRAEVLWYLANALARAGKTQQARELLEELAQGSDPVYRPRAATLLPLLPAPGKTSP